LFDGHDRKRIKTLSVERSGKECFAHGFSMIWAA
jgi:hypothetical protein